MKVENDVIPTAENENDLMGGSPSLRNWIYSYLKYSPALTPEQQKSVKSRLRKELERVRNDQKDEQ